MPRGSPNAGFCLLKVWALPLPQHGLHGPDLVGSIGISTVCRSRVVKRRVWIAWSPAEAFLFRGGGNMYPRRWSARQVRLGETHGYQIGGTAHHIPGV